MRILFFAAFLLAGRAVFAQQSPIFLKVHTDVTVTVSTHSTGADLVEITMLNPSYPSALLQNQVQKMCDGIGTPARGLAVGIAHLGATSDPKFSFVRANFATNGIIGRDGVLKIQPILRALAGAPEPYTIRGITLEFSGVVPTASTLQWYELPGVLQAEGRVTAQGPLQGVEYRVNLLSQDPTRIEFPEKYAPSQRKQPEKVVPIKSNRTTLMVLFVLTGIAAGALVYFAMLRSGSKAHS